MRSVLAHDIARHFSLKISDSANDGTDDASFLDDAATLLEVSPDGAILAVAVQNELALFSTAISQKSKSPGRSRSPAVLSLSSTPALAAAQLAQHDKDRRYNCLHASTCSDNITSLQWVSFATPTPPQPPSDQQQHAQQRKKDANDAIGSSLSAPYPPDASSSARVSWGSGGGGQSGRSLSAVSGSLQDQACDPAQDQQANLQASTCLLLGTAAGYIQVHDRAGTALIRQRLHSTPVQAIRARTHRMGLSTHDADEEVTICFADALVRIMAWELRSSLRAALQCSGHRSTSVDGGLSSLFTSSVSDPLSHMSCQKWEVPWSTKMRTDAVCFGHRPRDLYTLLRGSSSHRTASSKLVFVTGGKQPALAALEADEDPQHSTLAALTGMATSISLGALSLAKTARSTVYRGPRALTDSLRSFVAHPFGAPLHAPRQQPLAIFQDLNLNPKADSATLWRQLKDEPRAVERLIPAPSGCLLAAADSLGRVLLLDAVCMTLVRVFKGYRDAQCAWLEVSSAWIEALLAAAPRMNHGTSTTAVLQKGAEGAPASATAQQKPTTPAMPQCGQRASNGCQPTLVLVLYAPKRDALEFWMPRNGPCLWTCQTKGRCRLLQTVGSLCAARAVGNSSNGNSSCSKATGKLSTAVLFESRTGRILDLRTDLHLLQRAV